MKHGTAYAKRVKRVYAQVKRQTTAPKIGEPADPLEQLILAVLSEETSPNNARKALNHLLEMMVDVNEVRVSAPREIANAIDFCIPNSHTCAARLAKVLNAVFDSENAVKLDSLPSMGKRDAKRWLEELQGIEPYHVASVMLWSLGGHAIPVNAKLFAALRKEKLVDPDASVAEVQSFLERHIPPAEAKAFCLTMADFSSRKHTPSSRTVSSTRTKATKKTNTHTARRKKAAPKS